jgi:very-short-patch-repair endonuclease
MNNHRDYTIARESHWYRIPVKSAPKIVRGYQVQYVAFYLTKVFGNEAFSIRSYADVDRITIVKRKELFPEEMDHPKKDEDYFKLQLRPLKDLPKPVVSKRWRRIVFIETTPSRLSNAQEVNDLFHESPLEDAFWNALKAEGIDAERQYWIRHESLRFALDFALFCKQRNIDVECDGDAYHLQPVRVRRDKKRNNILEKMGWSVLRYGSQDIYKQLPSTMSQVKETINRLGGLQVPGKEGAYRALPLTPSRGQESLFYTKKKF